MLDHESRVRDEFTRQADTFSASVAITDKALSEAHMFYAVPRYMDTPECQAFIRQMLPKAG